MAPLLFVQVLYGRLFLTSSVLMAWWWLAVVPLVILAYSGAYLLAFRGKALGPRAKAVAAGLPGVHVNAVVWGRPILPGEQAAVDPGTGEQPSRR